MKKRIVAVLLSLTLCMATVMETGAAAFDDQLFTDAPAAVTDVTTAEEMTGDIQTEVNQLPEGEITPTPEEPTPELPEEVTPTPETPAEETPSPEPSGEPTPTPGDSDIDVFVPGEELPDDNTEAPDGEIDVFSSGDTELLSAASIIEVNKTDWVQTPSGSGEWMLKKGENTYYKDTDGILYIKTVEDKSAPATDTAAHTGHSGFYMFDAGGILVEGRTSIAPGTPGYEGTTTEEYYFMLSTEADYLQGYESNAVKTPLNSNMGQLQKKYWLWSDGAFRYYDSTGKFLSMAKLKESRVNAGTYDGYYNINGDSYCLDDNGVPRVGDVELTDVRKPGKYYFQPAGSDGIPGKMFREGWLQTETTKGTQWRYYKSSGQLYERGIVATRLDTEVMGDYTYLLDQNGYIIKSKMVKAANNAYYSSDKNGRVYKSKLVKYGNYRYYFGSSGKRATWTNSWHRCPGASNRYYYFGKTAGRVTEKTGWQKVTSTSGKMYGWFYFSSNGNHYVNKWAQGGYFREDGRLASGITTVSGKTYFFQVSNSTEHRGKLFKSTWITYKGKRYYAGSNGVLYANGWKKISGAYYYFQEDFTVKTNTFATRNGVNGYLDSKGKYCTGWVVVDNATNKVRYVDPDGNGFVKNTSKVIGGLRYYFDKNGYRKNDLTSIYKGPYYVEVDRVNGVMTIFDKNRTTPVKSIRVSVGLPGTPTPLGTYVLRASARWQPLMGPSWGQYGTHVSGAGQGGIFVHSVAGWGTNSYSMPMAEYNKLGNPASHGCIRCCVADAKWVYYNCSGATIKIFDGSYKADEVFKGPLGRRALVKTTGNYDPTDPAI